MNHHAESRELDPYASETFEEFWPHYVRMHTRKETQMLHAIATLSWVGLGAVAIATRRPVVMLAAPLADYLIAQASHRIFEKNRTVPSKHFAWHTRAEATMLMLVLRGKMQAEVSRHGAKA